MVRKACIINEHLYEIMKEAFIDDVLNMMKIPEDTEQDNDNRNGNVSHDAGMNMLLMMKVSTSLGSIFTHFIGSA